MNLFPAAPVGNKKSIFSNIQFDCKQSLFSMYVIFLFHILSYVSVVGKIDFKDNIVKFDWVTWFSLHDRWCCCNLSCVLNVLLHLLHTDFCDEFSGVISLCWSGWLCDNGRTLFVYPKTLVCKLSPFSRRT